MQRKLLIEPVWNRNRAFSTSVQRRRGAFNRTSMESKPVPALNPDATIEAFNRTSMESKLFPEALAEDHILSF